MTDAKCRTESEIPENEGGWGYLVAFGLCLPFALTMAGLHSFGLMFNEFLTSIGAQTSAVTLIVGCYFSAQSFAGIFANILFKKYSMRTVGIFGACIYFLGHFLNIFVTSVGMLALSFGVLQGFGLGLMLPVGYTTFNQYFVTKRVCMMSLTQAMKGIVVMVHPILVKNMMDWYGFRGTMAIFAAINMHAIFGMLVMHPVKWHYKMVKLPKFELKPLTLLKLDIKSDKKVSISSDEDDVLPEMHFEKRERLNTLPHKWATECDMKNNNEMKVKRLIRSKSVGVPSSDVNLVRNRVASIISYMSLDDLGGGEFLTNRQTEPAEDKSSNCVSAIPWEKVVHFFDLTLLKDFVYMNIVIGIASAQFSDNLFLSLLPMYLKTLGFSMVDAAWLVSIGTVADLTSRISLAVLSIFFKINSRYIFLAGAIGFIIMRIVFLCVCNFDPMVATVIGLGICRTWIHVPVTIIFAEYLPPNRFPSGYGLYMFFQGNFVFLLGPIVGWIRDVTQSYVIFINCLQFFMCLCAIPWIIEMIWTRVISKKSNNQPSIA